MLTYITYIGRSVARAGDLIEDIEEIFQNRSVVYAHADANSAGMAGYLTSTP